MLCAACNSVSIIFVGCGEAVPFRVLVGHGVTCSCTITGTGGCPGLGEMLFGAPPALRKAQGRFGGVQTGKADDNNNNYKTDVAPHFAARQPFDSACSKAAF